MSLWTRLRRKGRRADTPQARQAELRGAVRALLEDDASVAERHLAALVRADSSDIDAYLSLAVLYRRRGEVGRAIQLHQNLLLRSELTPADRSACLLELAHDFRQGGFLQRAVAAYEEVLAHQSRHPVALRSLVTLLADLREYPRAIEMQRRLAKLEHASSAEAEADLLVRMAESEAGEGRSEAARRALRRALRKDARNTDGWLLLGQMEAERGRNKAALAAWRKIPQIDRERGVDVYLRLGSAFAALGKPRDFEKLLRALVAAQPDDVGARLALARALGSSGDPDAALAELRGVLDLDSRNLEARAILGRLLLAEQRHPDALKEYGQLLESLDSDSERIPRRELD